MTRCKHNTNGVYQAENNLRNILDQAAGGDIQMDGTTYTSRNFTNFITESEVKNYIDLVYSHPMLFAIFGPVVKPTVKFADSLGDHAGEYDRLDQSVSFSRTNQGVSESLVLHELAHSIVHSAGIYNDDDDYGHGAGFVNTLSKLYGIFVSPGCSQLYANLVNS